MIRIFLKGVVACGLFVGVPAFIEAFKADHPICHYEFGATQAYRESAERMYAATSTEEFVLWTVLSALVLIGIIFFVGLTVHDGVERG